MIRNPRKHQFCTKCGRRLVPYKHVRYPEYWWGHCPRTFFGLIAFGHDATVIIGDRDKADEWRFDPETGEKWRA